MASLEARKATVLGTCRDNYGSTGVLGVRELCECLIEGWHDDMERAKPERFQVLQGKIQGLRELLESIKPQQPAQDTDND